MLCIGALPFVNNASAYARDEVVEAAKGTEVTEETKTEEAAETTNEEAKKQNKWLDDYSQPVGFTYGVNAKVNAAYLWRGL